MKFVDGLHRTIDWYIYLASLADCRACPVRSQCNPGAKASRTVSRSFDHEVLDAVAEHLKTPRAREALRKRKQFIELVVADAKVRHGMHGAQRRGRENMLIQAVLTATTMNILKLARHSWKTGSGVAVAGNELRTLPMGLVDNFATKNREVVRSYLERMLTERGETSVSPKGRAAVSAGR